MVSCVAGVPIIKGVFRCVVPVRWGDLDAQNHVNNTVYFRYFEEARAQLFRQAGPPVAGNKVGILAHASCDFIRPVLYPATVCVGLVPTHVGRSSLHFDAFITCQDNPDVMYAKGKNIIVGTEIATGKTAPWLSSELNALASCFVK